jgi:pilus assembly protein Flp/PilA
MPNDSGYPGRATGGTSPDGHVPMAGIQAALLPRRGYRQHCEEYMSMKQLLVRFVNEDEGQDLVEYALLITFIALACIIGMQQLGTAINNRYNSISTSLAS